MVEAPRCALDVQLFHWRGLSVAVEGDASEVEQDGKQCTERSTRSRGRRLEPIAASDMSCVHILDFKIVSWVPSNNIVTCCDP